jgi:flagellar biosynthesis GTPase FlhF
MDTRTFRAPTMIEALQAVQKELGSDAIVVSMREAETGLWKKPCCEIVAAKPSIRSTTNKAAQPKAAAAEPKPAPKAARAEIDPALKESLAAMIKSVKEQNPGVVPVTTPTVKAYHPAGAAAPATKVTKPFTPEVLSKRISTRTWIVSDTEAHEQVKPEVIEKPAAGEPKPAAKPAALPAAVNAENAPKVETAKPEIIEEPEEMTSLGQAKKQLLNQGVDAKMVERMCQTCGDALSPARLTDDVFVKHFLQKQMLANLRPAIRIAGEGRKVVCLIGPNGAGKTSACAKLAAHFTLQEGLKVAWIEANTVRTGAIAEARMITESLGVDLHLVYGPEDLAEALINTQEADLVLMDTAGCNPRREANLVELGALITSLRQRTTLLVTSATTKEADLKQTLAAFGTFSLDGLVVTHMDETLTYGSIYNHACQSRLPVAYYTSDPAAMSGLEAGDGETLVNALFNKGM